MNDNSVLPKVDRFYVTQANAFYKKMIEEKKEEEREVVFKYVGSYSRPSFDAEFEEPSGIFELDSDFRSQSFESELDSNRSTVLQLSHSFEKKQINGRYKPNFNIVDFRAPPKPTTKGSEGLFSNVLDNSTSSKENFLNSNSFGFLSYEVKNNEPVTGNSFSPNYAEINYQMRVPFKSDIDVYKSQRRKVSDLPPFQSTESSSFPYMMPILSPRLSDSITQVHKLNKHIHSSGQSDANDLKDLGKRMRVNDLRKAYEERLQNYDKNITGRDLQNQEHKNLLHDFFIEVDNQQPTTNKSCITEVEDKTPIYTVERSTQTEVTTKQLGINSKWTLVKKKMNEKKIPFVEVSSATRERKNNENSHAQKIQENKKNHLKETKSKSYVENQLEIPFEEQNDKEKDIIENRVYDLAKPLNSERAQSSRENSNREASRNATPRSSTKPTDNGEENTSNYLTSVKPEVMKPHNKKNSLVDQLLEKNEIKVSPKRLQNHSEYGLKPHHERSRVKHKNTDDLSYSKKSRHKNPDRVLNIKSSDYKRDFPQNRSIFKKIRNIPNMIGKKNKKNRFKELQQKQISNKTAPSNYVVYQNNPNPKNNYKNTKTNHFENEFVSSDAKREYEVDLIQHERARNAKLYTRDIDLNRVNNRKTKSPRFKS